MSTLLQADPALPARETLPTMYDLPSEEIGDAGLPDEFHVHQAILLDETYPADGRARRVLHGHRHESLLQVRAAPTDTNAPTGSRCWAWSACTKGATRG
jgi:hypothetical protein